MTEFLLCNNTNIAGRNSDRIISRCYSSTMKLQIKEIREARHLKQIEVADAAGISRSYYNQIENGNRQVNAAVLETIAAVLGVHATELLAEPSNSKDPELQRHMAILKVMSEEQRRQVFQFTAFIMGGRAA